MTLPPPVVPHVRVLESNPGLDGPSLDAAEEEAAEALERMLRARFGRGSSGAVDAWSAFQATVGLLGWSVLGGVGDAIANLPPRSYVISNVANDFGPVLVDALERAHASESRTRRITWPRLPRLDHHDLVWEMHGAVQGLLAAVALPRRPLVLLVVAKRWLPRIVPLPPARLFGFWVTWVLVATSKTTPGPPGVTWGSRNPSTARIVRFAVIAAAVAWVAARLGWW